MKAMFVSFAVGLAVGVVYALLRVKSPAPPLVALVGLLGMVWGEQVVARFLVKRQVSNTLNAIRAGHPSEAQNPQRH
jgi:XapX domain-containing protein